MNIEQCEYYYTTPDTLYCGEHSNSVSCVLEINGMFIPLCQTCVDELYKQLSQFATKEEPVPQEWIDELNEKIKKEATK